MERTLVPEMLDFLPAHDPRALLSRRDLRRINRCMGNHRWWSRVVAPSLGPGDRILEIGAGDGMSCPLPGRRSDGLDLHPAPDRWPDDASWHRVPVHSFDGWDKYHTVVGNLIFHHFTEMELRRLGDRMRGAVRMIIACEPFRARRFQLGFTLLARIIGACDVTRHDGRASIQAGFRGDELPRALGLDPSEWNWSIDQTWLGAYRMIATRAE